MGPYRVWIQTRTFTYRVKEKKKTLNNDFYVRSWKQQGHPLPDHSNQKLVHTSVIYIHR